MLIVVSIQESQGLKMPTRASDTVFDDFIEVWWRDGGKIHNSVDLRMNRGWTRKCIPILLLKTTRKLGHNLKSLMEHSREADKICLEVRYRRRNFWVQFHLMPSSKFCKV